MNKDASQITDPECDELACDTYDIIRSIKDPEKSENLEELNVVQEDLVKVQRLSESQFLISVEFVPTVPHCTLATLIGKKFEIKFELFFFDTYTITLHQALWRDLIDKFVSGVL